MACTLAVQGSPPFLSPAITYRGAWGLDWHLASAMDWAPSITNFLQAPTSSQAGPHPSSSHIPAPLLMQSGGPFQSLPAHPNSAQAKFCFLPRTLLGSLKLERMCTSSQCLLVWSSQSGWPLKTGSRSHTSLTCPFHFSTPYWWVSRPCWTPVIGGWALGVNAGSPDCPGSQPVSSQEGCRWQWPKWHPVILKSLPEKVETLFSGEQSWDDTPSFLAVGCPRWSFLIPGKAVRKSCFRGKCITQTKAGSRQKWRQERPKAFVGRGSDTGSLFPAASPMRWAALCSHLQLLFLSCLPGNIPILGQRCTSIILP